MKILEINAMCGIGSTGRIVTGLMKEAKALGHIVKAVCSPREPVQDATAEEVIIAGSKEDYYLHNILSRITDHEGLYSKTTTKQVVQRIRAFNPDLIHVHTLHGHWINYEILFRYLTEENKKVIWTFHDCWPFTGHCVYFDTLQCEQWKEHCHRCKDTSVYPKCYMTGDAEGNFSRKKRAFTSVQNMTIVTPSAWMATLARESFFRGYRIEVIHNKIDLSIFKPTGGDFRRRYGLEGKKIVLGVANVWMKDKGLDDFIRLSGMLGNEYRIVLVGMTEEQKAALPERIIGLGRTNESRELAEIYTAADVFLNLTYQDTYSMVNLEAIACGTPVVTYNSGGAGETIDESSGIAVPKGAIEEIPGAIEKALQLSKEGIFRRVEEIRGYGNYMPLYANICASL